MRKHTHISIADASIRKRDKHPYISGFSKLVGWNDSYSDMLSSLQRTPAQALRHYWHNVGVYTWNVVIDGYEQQRFNGKR